MYPTLVDLLGKPHDHPDFIRFVDQLGEKPRVHQPEHVYTYDFPESGFEIVAVPIPETKHIFFAVTFFIDIPMIRRGEAKPYRGQFASGVTPADSLKDVMRKINLKPSDWFAETVLQLRYDYPHHTLHFSFREPDGEEMVLASVRLAQNNEHFSGQAESIAARS